MSLLIDSLLLLGAVAGCIVIVQYAYRVISKALSEVGDVGRHDGEPNRTSRSQEEWSEDNWSDS